MTTSVRLAEKLAELFNARVSTCTNTYKHLQVADLVSRGGRGRNAVKISASDSVMLLFALIGSEHINDGPEAARRYSSLVAKWRSSTGSYVDDRQETELRWYVMEERFPYLKTLPAGHSLLQAVVALVNSYTDGAIPIPQPVIAVTIRGPQVSATIRFEDHNGTEQMDYGPANGLDMFRTIIGNPNNPSMKPSSFLHVEKRVTAETLQEMGKLLRSSES